MSRKKVIFIGMTIGSLAGGFIASKFSADALSLASLLASSVGALIGIWIAFKLS